MLLYWELRLHQSKCSGAEFVYIKCLGFLNNGGIAKPEQGLMLIRR
jgi:hypothetical protein